MALAYTDVQVEIREISLQNRPEELYKVSKKGTVPVLITVDNLVIDANTSIDIEIIANDIDNDNDSLSYDISVSDNAEFIFNDDILTVTPTFNYIGDINFSKSNVYVLSK